MAKVLSIFICKDKGLPMSSVEKVDAITGAGLEGDRYSTGSGSWSKSDREAIRHVSLFGIEAFNEANSNLDTPFTLEETRRNILTEGIDLNALVGKTFKIGEVLFRGAELCDPCNRPSKLANKPGFKEAFDLKGGLRAEVLSDGVIEIGEEIIEM